MIGLQIYIEFLIYISVKVLNLVCGF